MMLSHNSITNYYILNFNLAQHHNYSISELENMIPFEYDLYVSLLVEYLEKKKLEQQQGS